MNWKVFLGFFVLPIIRVFRIDCLKVTDIVNGLNVGAKKGQTFGGIFKMGNIFEIYALKNDIGLMTKTYFSVLNTRYPIPDSPTILFPKYEI